MAILQKLKSLLGLGSARSEERTERDVSVTVERERGGTAEGVATDAVGGQDEFEAGSDAETEAEAETATEAVSETDESDADEPVITEAEADADEAAAEELPEEEPADEVEEPTESEAAVDEEEADESDEAETEAEADEEAAGTDEPVDSIKGIGPAYAERLSGVGVETVSDLAAADAEELAEGTDISATRIQGWIDRAKVR